MKRFLILTGLILCLISPRAEAEEGMWLLPYLKELVFDDMQALGLELTADQIYHINQSSLKDAVVIFGGGCTGEMISPRGLLLTNHHCAISEFQAMSTPENDYLEDGFWAMDIAEELPVPGLSVRFLIRISDVTDEVYAAVEDEEHRTQAIRQARRAIEREAAEEGRYRTSVELFRIDGEAQYLLFVYEEYADVRLVGAPPSSIGQFGGDEDNWEWPNHNADFALFRVYMEPDGSPSTHHDPDNVPYHPAHYFPISLAGLAEDDFVMAMGYPGRTTRYLTSFEILNVMEVDNTNRAGIRGMIQEVWREAMERDEAIRLAYASRYFGSSNYWKYSIGQNKALANLHVVEDARQLEERFERWMDEDITRKEKYGNVLPMIEHAVRETRKTSHSHQVIMEGLVRPQSYFGLGRRLHTLYNQLTAEEPNEESIERQIDGIRNSLDHFFRFDMPTEQRTLEVMMPYVWENVYEEHMPGFYAVIEEEFDGDTGMFIREMFEHSVVTDRDRLERFLDDPDPERLVEDLGYLMVNSAYDRAIELRQHNTRVQSRFQVPARRLWLEALSEMITERHLYPDANFTMRLTYGRVLGYEPRDAVVYLPFTTHHGILEKVRHYPDIYSTPDELIALLESADFGPYGQDGTLPLTFLSNIDITGGNSGSPVLNSRGELVGVAYDGNWEAMSSDIAYAPDLQRAISVDIRYVLFIVDKYAGADWLFDEMRIVR